MNRDDKASAANESSATELPAEIAERIVTPSELSEILGISTERIRQLRHRGIFKPIIGTRNSYGFVDAVRGYLNFKHDEFVRKKARLEQSASVTNARTREIELRIAEREAMLIPTEDVIAIIRDVVGMVREAFSKFPERAANYGFAPDRIAELEREVMRMLTSVDIDAEKAEKKLRDGKPFS